MSLLLESPVVVVAVGVLLVTVAAIFYLQTRTRGSFAALIACVLLTVGALVVERLWLTPTEQVRAVVLELFAAVERNELGDVLALVDASASRVRADAETLVPLFTVQSAAAGGVEVEVLGPNSARAAMKPLIKAQHKPSGMTGAYFDALRIYFVRRGDRWLVRDYEPAKDWRGEAGRMAR